MGYVDTTQVEFERWLGSTFPSNDWSRCGGTTGVYWIHLNDNVAVQINSTVSGGRSVGYSRVAMRVRLISRLTSLTLNKKANTTSNTRRTANWPTNLKAAVARMIAAWGERVRFYNFVALPKAKQDEVRGRQLEYLRAIYRESRKFNDVAAMAFARDVGEKVKDGWVVSDSAAETTKRYLAKYKIGRVA